VTWLVACSTGEPAAKPTPAVSTPRSTPPTAPAATGAPGPDLKGPLRPARGHVITRRGAVYSHVRFTGQVTIAADNVVLHDITVDSTGPYVVLVTGRNVRIEDAVLRGGPDTLAGLATTGRGQFVATRLLVSGSEDGVRLSDDCGLYDSVVRGLRAGPDAHNDAVTADGASGWRIVGNTIINRFAQTAAVWVGDSRYGPSDGVLQDNLLAGGGYTVYAGTGSDPGISVLGNRFSTRFHRGSGRYGPVTGWLVANNRWAGNTWADGPHAGAQVNTQY
jgi:hypothetical protein